MTVIPMFFRHIADLDFIALAVCVTLLATLSLTEGKLLW